MLVITAHHNRLRSYVLLSFGGQLSKGDKGRLDNLFRKTFRQGFRCQTLNIDKLIFATDKNYFVKCLILNILYILSYQSYQTIEIVKLKSHSETADITTLYHTARPTSSKSFLNRCLFSYIYKIQTLVCILCCIILYLVFIINILAFMCLCV